MKDAKAQKLTPYIWLQDEETGATAVCGCCIDGQAFYQCAVHAAAPELLDALKGIRDNWEKNLGQSMYKAAQAIAKAEGR